jgi:hypothetical protein
MNGVNVASVVIGAAATPYNIDAVGATNRWQSTQITGRLDACRYS